MTNMRLTYVIRMIITTLHWHEGLTLEKNFEHIREFAVISHQSLLSRRNYYSITERLLLDLLVAPGKFPLITSEILRELPPAVPRESVDGLAKLNPSSNWPIDYNWSHAELPRSFFSTPGLRVRKSQLKLPKEADSRPESKPLINYCFANPVNFVPFDDR